MAIDVSNAISIYAVTITLLVDLEIAKIYTLVE